MSEVKNSKCKQIDNKCITNVLTLLNVTTLQLFPFNTSVSFFVLHSDTEEVSCYFHFSGRSHHLFIAFDLRLSMSKFTILRHYEQGWELDELQLKMWSL